MAWVIGACIQLCGGIMINLATNLMKLGHNRRSEACAKGIEKPIYKYWQWLAGTLLFAVGNVCNFTSYAFASQALLTALSSVQFVCNVVFSKLLLKENVRLRVYVATAIIVTGNIIVVVFASKKDPDYSSLQLRELYLSGQFTIYLLAAVVGVPTLYVVSNHGLKKMATQGRKTPSLWIKLTPISYCLCSSLIGAQAVLFSTSLAILARKTLSGDNQLNSWFTAVLLAGFAVCAVIWVSRLNAGLRYFDAAVIIPMLQIIWILLIMVSGNLYFAEFNHFTKIQMVMFIIGLCLLLVGIYCLTPTKASFASQQSSQPSSQKPRKEGEPGEVDDAASNDELLGAHWGGAGQADSPYLQAMVPPLCLLPALGHLDVAAMARLPHEQLLMALYHLQHLPRTEQEAQQLEVTMQQLAWQLNNQHRELLAVQQELANWQALQQMGMRGNPEFALFGAAGQGAMQGGAAPAAALQATQLRPAMQQAPVLQATGPGQARMQQANQQAQQPGGQQQAAANRQVPAQTSRPQAGPQHVQGQPSSHPTGVPKAGAPALQAAAAAAPTQDQAHIAALLSLPERSMVEALMQLPDEELLVALGELQMMPKTEEGARKIQALVGLLEQKQQQDQQQDQQQQQQGGQQARQMWKAAGAAAIVSTGGNAQRGNTPLINSQGPLQAGLAGHTPRAAAMPGSPFGGSPTSQSPAGPAGGAGQQRRGSIARLANVAKGAAKGIRQSVSQAMGLLAGLGQNINLPAASLFSVPMMNSGPLAYGATNFMQQQQQRALAYHQQQMQLLNMLRTGNMQPHQ